MSNVSIKGITRIEIPNPSDQIRNSFIEIPDAYNRKVNPTTGRKLITNIPTQTLGNRVLACEVQYSDTQGNELIVSLQDFMPARDPVTGNLSKGLSGDIYADYRSGLSDDKIALREFWFVLSYFVGCMLTGQLPTPVKPSGQSTIMSSFIHRWLDHNGLEIESVTVTGKNDSRMVYTSDDFNNVFAAFQSNARRVLNDWDDRQGRTGGKSGRVEWV